MLMSIKRYVKMFLQRIGRVPILFESSLVEKQKVSIVRNTI